MRLTAGLATGNQPLRHRGQCLASIDQHSEKGLGIAQRQAPCIACRQGLAPRPHQIGYQRLAAAACGHIRVDALPLSTALCPQIKVEAPFPNTHLDPRGPGAFHLAWAAQAGRVGVCGRIRVAGVVGRAHVLAHGRRGGPFRPLALPLWQQGAALGKEAQRSRRVRTPLAHVRQRVTSWLAARRRVKDLRCPANACPIRAARLAGDAGQALGQQVRPHHAHHARTGPRLRETVGGLLHPQTLPGRARAPFQHQEAACDGLVLIQARPTLAVGRPGMCVQGALQDTAEDAFARGVQHHIVAVGVPLPAGDIQPVGLGVRSARQAPAGAEKPKRTWLGGQGGR